MRELNVGLLGGGSWGTTVASLLSRNAPTTIWARDHQTVEEINTCHSNEKYLPGASLDKRLLATYGAEECVAKADVVVVAIPSQYFRSVLEDIRNEVRPWVPIVSLSKGLDPVSGKRMTEVINEVFPGHPVALLTGPNLAHEILAGSAAASVIATEDENIARKLQQLFSSGLFRVYTNDDVIGCELGGVLKNIIAIATGMGDGLGAGDNTRATIITRGLAEITRLGVAMGGRPETFAGLTGMGDLIATCTSAQSRNRTVGFELGRGRLINDILAEMSMVAEGVKTAPMVASLAEEFGLDMPISQEVYEVLHNDKSMKQVHRGLYRSPAGSESDPG